MGELAAIENEPQLLRQFLSGRDVACPRCEYNLRDFTGDRCPECGDQIVLRVNLSEPRQAAAITALVALSAGTGFSGMLLMYLLVDIAKHGWRVYRYEKSFFWVTLIPFIVQGLCLVGLLKRWKAFRRKSSSRQWSLATICWLLTIVNLIVFTIFIR